MSHEAFDFSALSTLWLRVLDRALLRLARTAPGHTHYALALHGLYAETDGSIGEPTVASNSVEALVEDGGAEDGPAGFFQGTRWSPGDWRFFELDLPYRRERERAYRALTRHACRGGTAHWRRTEERHRRALVGVARALARSAKRKEGAFARLATTDDFVAFVHEPSADGLDWVRKSVSAPLFRRLFAEPTPPPRLEAVGRDDRAARLVARLGRYDGPITGAEAARELVQMGEAAVEALVGRLHDAKVAVDVMRVLFDIGAPAAHAAVPALEREMWEAKPVPRREWSARVLGRLGRLDLLEATLVDPRVGACAVEGLLIARPASYSMLERALRAGPGPIAKAIRERMRSCPFHPEVSPEMLEAIEAAFDSVFPEIRANAATLLASPGLGARGRRRAVDLLVGRLDDGDAEVRRRIVLALGRCGGDVRRHRDRLLAMRNDPSEAVRRGVEGVLNDLR